MPTDPLDLWAFLENSDFQRYKNGRLYRQDEVALIKHDLFLETDYQLMADIHCVGVRDAARWYKSHPARGQFDWTWLDRVVTLADKYELRLYIDLFLETDYQLMADIHCVGIRDAARWYRSHPARGQFDWTWLDRVVTLADKYELKLYIDLWHYGYPDWLDLMSAEAVDSFTEFAGQIARRYPSIEHYCVCNEPSLLVEMGGRQGVWAPFLHDPIPVRRQVCRMIVEASKAILSIKPEALLVLPEPWHATRIHSSDDQAAVFDTVLGLRDPELGGADHLISILGLNHYRDSTLPPLHKLLLNARKRWPHKPLWLTETSGPPTGWQQEEWFWWMLAETRLANMQGAGVTVFTWAPAISMFDWLDETLQLPNGIWVLDAEGARSPNGFMLEALALAREYGYIR